MLVRTSVKSIPANADMPNEARSPRLRWNEIVSLRFQLSRIHPSEVWLYAVLMSNNSTRMMARRNCLLINRGRVVPGGGRVFERPLGSQFQPTPVCVCMREQAH